MGIYLTFACPRGLAEKRTEQAESCHDSTIILTDSALAFFADLWFVHVDLCKKALNPL